MPYQTPKTNQTIEDFYTGRSRADVAPFTVQSYQDYTEGLVNDLMNDARSRGIPEDRVLQDAQRSREYLDSPDFRGRYEQNSYGKNRGFTGGIIPHIVNPYAGEQHLGGTPISLDDPRLYEATAGVRDLAVGGALNRLGQGGPSNYEQGPAMGRLSSLLQALSGSTLGRAPSKGSQLGLDRLDRESNTNAELSARRGARISEIDQSQNLLQLLVGLTTLGPEIMATQKGVNSSLREIEARLKSGKRQQLGRIPVVGNLLGGFLA